MGTNIDVQKWGVFGGIIGILTPILLNFLSNLNIPGISITQATIAVDFQLPNVGLAGWLGDIVGVSLASIPGNVYIMAAIGGALFAIVGAFAVNALGMLSGTPGIRLAKVLAAGTLLAAWIPNIIGGEGFGIPSIASLVALSVSSLVLGFLYFQGFKAAGQSNLIP